MSREYPCVYYENRHCLKYSDDEAISFCVEGPCSDETPSNADRIRSMSDEELARYFSNMFNLYGYVEPNFLEWLQQPAEEE